MRTRERTPGQLPPEAVAALNAGRRIDAIRIVRERQGMGLMQAK